MLKTIERLTGQRIVMEKVPTVADLRARRLELTRAALRESLLEDDLDGFRAVVEALTDEFDVMEVAAAAVKLAHEATTGGGGDDDHDIPEVAARVEERAPYDASRSRPTTGAPARKGRVLEGPTAKLFIGLGRAAGVRPQDLVGAITGESSLSGRDIGGIEIAERFALVEVPERAAEEVISALRATMIKGRKATVRRDGKR